MATAQELKQLAKGGPSASELKAMAKEESPAKEFAGQFAGSISDIGVGALELMPVRTMEKLTGLEAPTKTGVRESLGLPTEEPETMAGRAGELSGIAAGLTPALGGPARMVPMAKEGAKRAPAFFQNLVSRLGQQFAKRPGTTTAAEGVAGASAGAVGAVAEEKFPTSDYARLTGEILGGMAPSMMPSTLAVRGANFLRGKFSTFRRGMKRAGERIQRAVPEDARGAAAQRLDEPTTIDPETGRPVLSLAQRTDDPGLLALEKDVMSATDQLRRAGDEQIARANQVIQESAREIGGPVEPTTETIQAAQEHLKNLLNTRLRIATQRADERVNALGPTSSREQANRIASEELEKVVKSGRAQERQLYDAIPENTAVPYTQTENRFTSLKNSLGRAQKDDVPEVAERLLNRGSKDFVGKGRPAGLKGNETTIKEMRALQSKLRNVARNARAGDDPNFNKARIADDLADTITEDLANAAAPGAADDIAIAVQFSRDFNDRVSRGTVGKLLGRTRAGGDRIPSGQALEQSVGLSGPKGRDAFDDVLRAFDSPEAPDSSTVIQATSDYLKDRFLNAAKDGVNKPAVKRLMNSSEELLNRLPELRKQFDEAIESGNLQQLRQRQAERVSFDNPKVSKATMLIQKGPVETFESLSRLNPVQAAREARNLVNMVNRDTSGEALEGLKSSFVDYVMSGARESARDATGQRFASGFRMREILDNPSIKKAAETILTKGERDRLRKIQNDLTKLERRRGISQTREGVLGDVTGTVLRSIAGVAGARMGSATSRATGGGGTVQIPGIMANRFRDMTAMGIEDPARRLITDSVNDEKLFRQLLMSKLDEGELSKQAGKRLRTWAAAVLAEKGADDESTEAADRASQIEAPAL